MGTTGRKAGAKCKSTQPAGAKSELKEAAERHIETQRPGSRASTPSRSEEEERSQARAD